LPPRPPQRVDLLGEGLQVSAQGAGHLPPPLDQLSLRVAGLAQRRHRPLERVEPVALVRVGRELDAQDRQPLVELVHALGQPVEPVQPWRRLALQLVGRHQDHHPAVVGPLQQPSAPLGAQPRRPGVEPEPLAQLLARQPQHARIPQPERTFA
jgi:hypothetical protein